MLTWMANNKDWLFSGIGATAFFGLVRWIFIRRNRASSASNTINQKQRGGPHSINVQIGNIEGNDR